MSKPKKLFKHWKSYLSCFINYIGKKSDKEKILKTQKPEAYYLTPKVIENKQIMELLKTLSNRKVAENK